MRAAVVTGVSRGLGEALAATMLAQGFAVLRFSHREVMTEINGVLEAIYSQGALSE